MKSARNEAHLWLMDCLARHKVFELDRSGHPTTL